MIIDPVRGRSMAHVDHFDVIVGVLREIGKPGVWPHGDELSFVQQQLAVNFVGKSMHVKTAVLPAA